MEKINFEKLSEMKKELTYAYVYFKANLNLYNALLFNRHLEERQNQVEMMDASLFATEKMVHRIDIFGILSIVVLAIAFGFLPITCLWLALPVLTLLFNIKNRKLERSYVAKTKEAMEYLPSKINLSEEDQQLNLDDLYDAVFMARCEYHQLRQEYEAYLATLPNEQEWQEAYYQYLVEKNFPNGMEEELAKWEAYEQKEEGGKIYEYRNEI